MNTTGRDKFGKFKPIIFFIVKIFSIFPKFIIKSLLNFFRAMPGKGGLLLRYIFVKILCKSCGDNVSIHPNVYLFNISNLNLGNNISIHPMCYIDAAGTISIGDNVSIAHSASILSTDHTWEEPTIPIKYNPETMNGTIIEEDVWIGCGSRILSGVKLHKRTVVAAGAVVTKTFEGNSVLGGVPAKLIKKI